MSNYSQFESFLTTSQVATAATQYAVNLTKPMELNNTLTIFRVKIIIAMHMVVKNNKIKFDLLTFNNVIFPASHFYKFYR